MVGGYHCGFTLFFANTRAETLHSSQRQHFMWELQIGLRTAGRGLERVAFNSTWAGNIIGKLDNGCFHQRLVLKIVNPILNIAWLTTMVSLLIWMFPKIGVLPVLIHFKGTFSYKPSSYWGTPIYGTPHVAYFFDSTWPTSQHSSLASMGDALKHH